ncbi:MAG: type II secretion system F family protein [Bacillota bacterium]|jgi:Flp pilus assembly protein TadB
MKAIVLPSFLFASSAFLVVSDLAHTRKGWAFGQAASGHPSPYICRVIRYLVERARVRSVAVSSENQSAWEDICSSLAFHIRAGDTVAQSLKSVSFEGDSEPYCRLRKAFAAYEAGSSIVDSLISATQGDPHMEYVSGIFQLGAVSGGDLPTLLCQASDTLRRRRMKKREARAMMTESRLTAIILTLMPWAIGFYTARFDSRATAILLTDPVGRALLLVALLLWVLGVLVVWWLIRKATPTTLR